MAMHPTTRTTLVSLAIGLIAIFMTVGVSAASGQFAQHGALTTAGDSGQASAIPAAVPAVTATCPSTSPAACVEYVPGVLGYVTLPYAVSGFFNLTHNHGFYNSSNAKEWATVANFSGAILATFDLNSTIPATTTNTSAFAFSVNDTTIGCAATKCANIPATTYSIVTTAQITNGTNVTTVRGFGTVYFVTAPLAVSLAVTAAAVGTTTSVNLTFASKESGQYITSVAVTLYSSTNSSVVIFSATLVNSTGVSKAASFVVGPGTYPASVTLITVYGKTLTENSTVAAFASTSTVYSNSTNWHNASIFGGLNPAVAGTLLLVIGLIIGLIVAMVLGRMVWGETKPAPAQPWTDTKPANVCSVCGKSFATPEELAAHGKSEHGMQ